jgi:hypothetical protein
MTKSCRGLKFLQQKWAENYGWYQLNINSIRRAKSENGKRN